MIACRCPPKKGGEKKTYLQLSKSWPSLPIIMSSKSVLSSDSSLISAPPAETTTDPQVIDLEISLVPPQKPADDAQLNWLPFPLSVNGVKSCEGFSWLQP
jgi:hypothetical protein